MFVPQGPQLGTVELLIAGILCGTYSASLVHCLRWLCFTDEGWEVRSLKKINWAMLAITLFLFLVSTTNFFFTEIEQFRAGPILGSYSDTVWGSGVLWFLNDLSLRLTVLFVDGVMIYRCWAVFAKSWRAICIPLAGWWICVAMAFFQSVCDLRQRLTPPRPLDVACTFLPVIAFYAINIIISTYATSAIVFRILQQARTTADPSSGLRRICWVVAQSGALYTFSSALFLCSSILAIEKFTLLASPLILFMPGIAFNLFQIRIGEQRAHPNHDWVDCNGWSGASTAASEVNSQNSFDRIEPTKPERGGSGSISV